MYEQGKTPEQVSPQVCPRRWDAVVVWGQPPGPEVVAPGGHWQAPDRDRGLFRRFFGADVSDQARRLALQRLTAPDRATREPAAGVARSLSISVDDLRALRDYVWRLSPQPASAQPTPETRPVPPTPEPTSSGRNRPITQGPNGSASQVCLERWSSVVHGHVPVAEAAAPGGDWYGPVPASKGADQGLSRRFFGADVSDQARRLALERMAEDGGNAQPVAQALSMWVDDLTALWDYVWRRPPRPAPAARPSARAIHSARMQQPGSFTSGQQPSPQRRTFAAPPPAAPGCSGWPDRVGASPQRTVTQGTSPSAVNEVVEGPVHTSYLLESAMRNAGLLSVDGCPGTAAPPITSRSRPALRGRRQGAMAERLRQLEDEARTANPTLTDGDFVQLRQQCSQRPLIGSERIAHLYSVRRKTAVHFIKTLERRRRHASTRGLPAFRMLAATEQTAVLTEARRTSRRLRTIAERHGITLTSLRRALYKRPTPKSAIRRPAVERQDAVPVETGQSPPRRRPIAAQHRRVASTSLSRVPGEEVPSTPRRIGMLTKIERAAVLAQVRESGDTVEQVAQRQGVAVGSLRDALWYASTRGLSTFKKLEPRQQQAALDEARARKRTLRQIAESYGITLPSLRHALTSVPTRGMPKSMTQKMAQKRPRLETGDARDHDHSYAAKPSCSVKKTPTKANLDVGSSGTRTARVSAQPGAKGSATRSVCPTLGDLIREYLDVQREPRSIAEIASALAQAHPGRGIKLAFVHRAVEGLVAKARVERSKRGSLMYYAAVVRTKTSGVQQLSETADA